MAATTDRQTAQIITFPARQRSISVAQAGDGNVVKMADRRPRLVVDYDAWYHAEAVREDRGPLN